jgi:GTP1/Obg family GTP-binding protein
MDRKRKKKKERERERERERDGGKENRHGKILFCIKIKINSLQIISSNNSSNIVQKTPAFSFHKFHTSGLDIF